MYFDGLNGEGGCTGAAPVNEDTEGSILEGEYEIGNVDGAERSGTVPIWKEKSVAAVRCCAAAGIQCETAKGEDWDVVGRLTQLSGVREKVSGRGIGRGVTATAEGVNRYKVAAAGVDKADAGIVGVGGAFSTPVRLGLGARAVYMAHFRFDATI
jgi:hypothetical protein